MSFARRIIKKLLYFDIDSYFLFGDSFCSNWINQNSNYRPSSLDVTFEVVDCPHGDSKLISLCEEGGYFGGDAKSIRERLLQREELGDRCVVARYGTYYVAMGWVLLGIRSSWPPFAQVPLEESDVGLLHQIYVKPEYRGFHLQRFLDIQQKKHLFDNGIKNSLTCVGVKNFGSIRNAMTCNERYRLIYHLSVQSPFLGRRNFFPKWSQEGWNYCQSHAVRWSPESESAKGKDQSRIQNHDNK